MSSSVDSCDDPRHASSRTKFRLRLAMRSCALRSLFCIGCFYVSAIQGVVALPKIPGLPAPATVSSVATLPHHVYYYRGHYYRYRYHGAYYGHRYYRYGRWHYY